MVCGTPFFHCLPLPLPPHHYSTTPWLLYILHSTFTCKPNFCVLCAHTRIVINLYCRTHGYFIWRVARCILSVATCILVPPFPSDSPCIAPNYSCLLHPSILWCSSYFYYVLTKWYITHLLKGTGRSSTINAESNDDHTTTCVLFIPVWHAFKRMLHSN